MSPQIYLILFYKGDISALTLFCQQLDDGAVCFPPLPALSDVVDEDQRQQQENNLLPGSLIQEINRQLQLDDDILHIEPAFYEQIETPDGIASVYMARFKMLDPPHDLMAERGCKMQTLTALIGRPPAEMELLRRAYTAVMES